MEMNVVSARVKLNEQYNYIFKEMKRLNNKLILLNIFLHNIVYDKAECIKDELKNFDADPICDILLEKMQHVTDYDFRKLIDNIYLQTCFEFDEFHRKYDLVKDLIKKSILTNPDALFKINTVFNINRLL
jgi:hypothetical protein